MNAARIMAALRDGTHPTDGASVCAFLGCDEPIYLNGACELHADEEGVGIILPGMVQQFLDSTVKVFSTAWQEECGRLCRAEHDRYCCHGGKHVVIRSSATDRFGYRGGVIRIVGSALPVVKS